MKTSAASFIKNVKNAVNDGQFFYVVVKKSSTDGETEDYLGEEIKSIVLTSEEDAVEEARKLAATLNPAEDEMLESCVCRGEISADDIDWDATGDDDEAWENFLMEYASGIEDEEVTYSETVCHQYKSIEGDIFVAWRWKEHIGYARNFIDIFEADEDDNERMYLPIDRVSAVQCSLLISAEERKGMNREKMESVIKERLNSIGKWGHGEWKNITDAIADAAEKYSK